MKTKNLITSLVLLFLYSSLSAQTLKGNFVLLGKTNLTALFSNVTTKTDSVETGNNKSTQYDFTAGGALFIADDLSFGVTGTYSYAYSKTGSDGYNSNGAIFENITRSATLMPQLQYFIPTAGKLRPVVVIGGGYVWMQERDSRVNSYFNKVYSISGPSFTGGAGLSYFIDRAVSFDLGFQYSYSSLKDKTIPDQVQHAKQLAGTMGVSVYF